MAKYRKVDPRIWNDLKFRSLSDDGKLAFLFLLTHPQMTAIGAMRGTIPGLAAELGWSAAKSEKAFGEAFLKGMAKHDPNASFLWLPNFLKYNRPESPNVVKAWVSALDLLPECAMFFQLLSHIKDYAEAFGEAFGEALPEAFGKTMPYQEQEQEQEQDKTYVCPATPPSKKKSPSEYPPDFELFWSSIHPDMRRCGKQAAFNAYRKADSIPGPDMLIRAVAHQQSRWKPGYVPMATTWLNQGRWDVGENIQQPTLRELNVDPF
jgi:hypothetical protein